VGPGAAKSVHGALAERSLSALIPGEDKFPYTMRVGERHPRIQRFELRRPRSAAPRWRSMDAGAPMTAHVRRHCDGTGAGRQGLSHPHRHRRRRRPLRRHGFQSRRHPLRHHRPSDGYQGARTSPSIS
jgi:hypothetical protein